MPRFVIKVVGKAGTVSFTQPPAQLGQYLSDFDVDAHDGAGAITTTADISRAIVFESFFDAWSAWRTQSTVQPLREYDGKPNRPLTAFTIEIVTVEP